jgi:hypothetical protein
MVVARSLWDIVATRRADVQEGSERQRKPRGAAVLAIWLAATITVMFGLAQPVAAAAPDAVSFTLAGCRNDGTIMLPNSGGKFICPDSAYTTGNLGKGWNELDLVPYRLTADAGNAAPANQTYTIAVVVDNKDSGAPGYDVLSTVVLNTALSDAGCIAPVVGGETIAAPGLGGIDESRYRLVTITQPKNTECVYDFYARLALGSHLFPGSSLHANLALPTSNGGITTSGIGARDVSIPVKEISPQELDKTMVATQDATHIWTLVKQPSPAALTFADVCDVDNPRSKNVAITVSWEKLPASPSGDVIVVTKVYATNPAARVITVNVTDKIYAGSILLDTLNSDNKDVPANTANFLVLTHVFTVPADDAINLNDVATATYTDKITGVPIPGTTTATASAAVQPSGITKNATATIEDSESISGQNLSFAVHSTSGASGTFDNYTLDTSTTGPVDWTSSSQSGSSSVTFNKSVSVSAPVNTSGTLEDTATLEGWDGFTANAGAEVEINVNALVTLTINKSIPNILAGSETATFDFNVSGPSGDKTASISFGAGEINNSVSIPGLMPGSYTISEVPQTGWVVQPPQNITISLPSCSGSVSFTNSADPAAARVKKVSVPAGFEAGWSFTLRKDGTFVETISSSGAGFEDFAAALGEGNYTISEQSQPGWDSDGGVGCSFSVDLPADANKTFSCTFTNTYQPSVSLGKEGDELSKAGDDVAYTLVVTNTSPAPGMAGAPSLVCTVSDAKIGFSKNVTLAPGASNTSEVPFTIPGSTTEDPYRNTASVSCTYGSGSVVASADSNTWSTNLFQPSYMLTKSGPEYALVGDTVVYTIRITNTSSSDSPPLELVDFSDTKAPVTETNLPLACQSLASGASCSFTYQYTVLAGDGSKVSNTATAIYGPQGFPNRLTRTGSWDVGVLRPNFVVDKLCKAQPVPQSGPATFTVIFTNTGNADLVITADDGIGTFSLAAGASKNFDVTVNGPFAGQATADNTVTASAALAAIYGLNRSVGPKTASASCSVYGLAKVVKTVNGAAPSGTQAFTFQLRQGASPTQNGTTLETLVANAANGGVLNFGTNLTPGQTYQLCEIVMPGWLTSLGTFVPDSFMPPDGVVANPNVDNSILCANFSVGAGETKIFSVDNTPPPGGRALTIGFWKNWASCSSSKGKGQKPVLDQTLAKAEPTGIVVAATSGSYPAFGPTYYLVLHDTTANPDVASDCIQAVRLLDKSTIGSGKKMASDPAFNLAAQLVAAQLNYTAGAGKTPAATSAINQAVQLLGKYKFDGNKHDKISAADTTTMNNLAKILDDYNNNR